MKSLGSIKLSDPLVLKAGAGVALYAFCPSRLCRMAGLALVGWAAWEWFKAPSSAQRPAVVPYDPSAQTLEAAAANNDPTNPFAQWPTEIPPLDDANGKVIPLFPEHGTRAAFNLAGV